MGNENKPIADKLNVEIDSMKALGENLKGDAEAYDSQMNRWKALGRDEHPVNAQIGRSGENFVEGDDVRKRNLDSFTAAMKMISEVKLSLFALQQGVENIADLYKGKDGFANVKLKQIQEMFPAELPKGAKTPEPRLSLPDPSQWGMIRNDRGVVIGYDFDNDGTMDQEIPGADGDAPPKDLANSQSENSIPKDVDGKTVSGYQTLFDTTQLPEGDNRRTDYTLSEQGRINLEQETGNTP
ncbi:hypothetical protein ACFO1B_26990 [Dactylosporangium siamense]|nr:hypothetical protein [Dactylosporangium siamense]